MASTKKTIPELTAITIVDGEFLLVIHDGTSTKKLKVSDLVRYILDQNAAEGGGTNPGGTAPENPESGKTTWIDTSDPESPSLKLFINGNWVNLSNPDAGDMMKSTYDPDGHATDIFKYIDDAIKSAAGNLPTEDLSNFADHIADADIHVTSSQKSGWNTAAEHVTDTSKHLSAEQLTALTNGQEHIADNDKHVSSSDKTKWNAASTHATDTTAHPSETEKTNWGTAYNHSQDAGVHVTAAQKTAWDAKVTPTQLATELAKVEPAVTGVGQGAGGHNGMYRGKKLGTAVTAAQWAAIADGSFSDMFIGDYWEIDGTIYRIAAFDYYLQGGDTACTKHHVTIVPDGKLGDAKMNSTAVTTTGYAGSDMFKTNLASAKTKINSAFGAAHILSHRMYFTNASSNGKASGGSWYDSTVDLMSEINVYGCRIFTPGSNGSTVPSLYSLDKSQYPLFKFRPDLIMDNKRQWYWLRDVVAGSFFADVSGNGGCTYNDANTSGGVRPAFNIVGN